MTYVFTGVYILYSNIQVFAMWPWGHARMCLGGVSATSS